MSPVISLNAIDWISRFYFGVPKRVCKWFSARCASNKILTGGLLGIPLFAVVSMAAYADFYRSILPLQMLIAGAVQFAIEMDPTCSSSVPPALAEAIDRLTPGQLETSEAFFQGLLFVMAFYGFLVVWGLSRICRSIVNCLR